MINENKISLAIKVNNNLVNSNNISRNDNKKRIYLTDHSKNKKNKFIYFIPSILLGCFYS